MADLSRDVVLPGKEYRVREWTVRSGSAVKFGDTVAHAVPRDASGGDDVSSRSSTKPSSVKHKRPSMKNRKPKTDEESKDPGPEPSADSSNRLLPSSSSIVSIVSPLSGILKIAETIADDELRIAYVEPCSHPAIMGGLCAVCGESVGPVDSSPGQNRPLATPLGDAPTASNKSMSQVTVSGGVTMTVSETEAQLISSQSMQKLKENRKLSLVLDLDHTLVHATADPRAKTQVGREDVRTLILPAVENPGPNTPWMLHYIKLRPYLKEFFEHVIPLYEISVYTAGTRSYAEQITMVLSRCVAGTSLDDDDIQQLRHEVERVRHDLKRKRELVAKGEGEASGRVEGPTKETADSPSDGDTQMNGDDEKPKLIKDDCENETRKRKRVSFGEAPPEIKTDELTGTDLESRLKDLEKKLEEAERLDKKALAFRQKLFGSRIISRTDVGDLGRDVKSLKRVFPCGGTMAVILDDREDVWANAENSSETRKGEPPDNLLLVRPYHWKPFQGFADVNNASGLDLSANEQGAPESNAGDEEFDDQLQWCVDILQRVHEQFYSESSDVSAPLPVARLIEKMRWEVLQGCKLVLSGLVPLHKQKLDAKAPRPRAIRYAQVLGAQVSDVVESNTTHVVATRDGTDKANRARKIPDCAVVKASWLMECYWRIKRCDVQSHLWESSRVSSLVSPVKLSEARSAHEESSSDSDSDDLAAELEAEMLG